MFKRILVPLDGTATAERAIPVAAQLAHAMGGVVVLLRVVHTAAGPHAHLLGSIIEAELTEAEHYLTGIATWPMLADSTTATDVVFGPGEVALTILSRAHAYHVDLIVMCSQTHSGLWSRIWGSIAEWVAYTASVPVLLLRDRGSLLIGHVNAFHPLRALVALDGSRQAEEALMPTASLIAALTTPARGVLHLVRVIQESPGGIEQWINQSTPCEPTSSRFFRHWAVQTDHLILE